MHKYSFKYGIVKMISSRLVFGFFLFLLIFLNGSSGCLAQFSASMDPDPQVQALMNQYVRINKSISHVSGWRITVISTVDRREVEDTKIQFQKNFQYKVKWEYKEPYYHLRAGAFLSRADALAALDQVKKKFSSAFISIDKIEYSEF